METKQVKAVGLDEFDLRAFQFESYDFKGLCFSKVLNVLYKGIFGEYWRLHDRLSAK